MRQHFVDSVTQSITKLALIRQQKTFHVVGVALDLTDANHKSTG